MATLVRWCAFLACALLALGFGAEYLRPNLVPPAVVPPDYTGPLLVSCALLAPGVLLSLLTWALWSWALARLGEAEGAGVVLFYALLGLAAVALLALWASGGTLAPASGVAFMKAYLGLLGVRLVLLGYMVVTFVLVLLPNAFPPKRTRAHRPDRRGRRRLVE